MRKIDSIEDILAELNRQYEAITEYGNVTKHSESIRLAIDIIKKYQKILEMYQWVQENTCWIESRHILEKLKEIIEDDDVNR